MQIKLPELRDRKEDIRKRVDAIVLHLYSLAREIEKAFQSIDDKNMNKGFLEKEREMGRLPVGSIILRKEGMDNGGMPYGTWSMVQKVRLGDGEYLLYRRNQ